MSKKSEFIEYVKTIINEQDMNNDARAYWDALINGSDKVEKKPFTDNGKAILKYLQTMEKNDVAMKSKDIADLIGISSRSVAGSMKKLCADGYVESIGDGIKLYCITDAGRSVAFED